MNEVTDRRSTDCPRIPIDVPIEITEGDYSDPVEADAVTLGQGGLSMRAAFLPELGSTLTCRFSSSASGRYVEATGEVVWAQDRGPHVGEFGVRFIRVDGESREAIAEMVAAWGDLMTDHDVEPPAGGVMPVAQPAARETRPRHAGSTLYIEGVASPIVTNLIHDGAETSIMEQALPFLRIGRGVTVEGGDRRGILSTVALRVEGDMPRLVLGVEWDSPPSVQTACTKEDTLHDFEAPTFDESEDLLAAVTAIMDEGAPEVDELGILIGEAEFTHGLPAGDTLMDDFASELGLMRPSLRQRASTFLGWLRGHVVALRPRVAKMFGKIGPTLVFFWRQIMRHAPRLWGHVALWARKITEPPRRGLHTLVNAVRIRMGMKALSRRRGGRRRRTSLPPQREAGKPSSPRRRQGATELPRRAGGAGRWAMFALLLIGVGLGIYALTPAESVEADEATSAGDQAPPLGTVERPTAYRVAAPAVPEPEPEATPAEADELTLAPEPVVAPRMPSALPEATRQAGPLGALNPEDVPETPADEPTAAVDGRSFGVASVENGRVFRLRMSLPVQTITGERIADGFRVTIPESLALDRAGPIAASHPDVDRAMILNRGDHAELTIRFVEGRAPAYRVRARGATLELTIGR